MCPWIQYTVNTHPSQGGLLQLSATAPSSPSQTGWWQWCEAVVLDQGNSVWAPTPRPPPLPVPSHPATPPPRPPKPPPPSTPPPLSVERAVTLGPSDSAPQTCLFLSQQWKLAWCRTPMHTARLRGCLCAPVYICVYARVYVCVCIYLISVCGLEWQCHLLITGPTLCRQGDLAERLRGLGGYYCAPWQVSPIQGLSKQRFHETVRSEVSHGVFLQGEMSKNVLIVQFLCALSHLVLTSNPISLPFGYPSCAEFTVHIHSLDSLILMDVCTVTLSLKVG